MPIYSSPGVYQREIDLSQIVKLSGASTGCLVFGSNMGPITPQFITSDKQFIEMYGKPNSRVSMAHYAAVDFLREGGSLWALRVVNSATYPVISYNHSTGVLAAQDAMADPTAYTFATNESFVVYPVGPGAYSTGYSIKLNQVEYAATTASIGTGNAVLTAFSGTLASLLVAPNSITITAGAITGTDNGTGQITGTGISSGTINYATGAISVTFAAAPADGVDISVDYSYNNKEFNLQVYDNANLNTPLESFNVSMQKQLDGYGKQMYIEDVINVFSNHIRVYDNAADDSDVYLIPTSPKVFGGTGNQIPSNGSTIGDSQLTTGWETFVDTETYTVNLLINGGYATPAVHQKMESVASRRLDAFAILDLPSASQTTATALLYRRNTLNMNSSYAALYGPDWLRYDEWNDLQVYVPPSVAAAPIFVRTDTVRDPWWAPAGLNRGIIKNALGLKYKYLKGDRDQLYENQINYIQNFPGEGIALFGQKTQQAKASALQSINVRRLLLVTEKAISSALKYSVFEPNDPFTRTQITLMVTEFLQDVKNRRGITKFLVVCDESNNTPQTVDSNQLNVDVYIAPTRAAEFIQLSMVVTKSGANLQELAKAGGF